jgi:hypothetical protein
MILEFFIYFTADFFFITTMNSRATSTSEHEDAKLLYNSPVDEEDEEEVFVSGEGEAGEGAGEGETGEGEADFGAGEADEGEGETGEAAVTLGGGAFSC